MTALAIFALIPDDLLDELATATGVNKYAKKLQAQGIFKLLIYCVLTHKDNSLRKMESTYEAMGFSIFNATNPHGKVRYNSISERLSTMKYDFFEKLYLRCLAIYIPLCEERKLMQTPLRFDSTIVTLSSKLLHCGYTLKGTAAHLNNVKFTIGYNGLPIQGAVNTESKYTSENIALRESLLKPLCDKSKPIRLFDRGISARKTYDKLTAEKSPFISRIHCNSRRLTVSETTISPPIETKTLLIYRDTIIHLFAEDNQKTKTALRCVHATQKETNDEIQFITNITDLEADEIAALYKQRWEIEVFFKFLKQELNFSHLVNRSLNGINTMFYVTLIAAILLLVYKKAKKLNGFKIVKQNFCQELEKAIVIEFIKLCGGDTNQAGKILNLNSS